MELHKLRLQIISGIVLGVLWGVAQVQAIECFTPLEWQDKLGSRWNRDANGDNVDDVIFRSIVDRVDVLLDLNDCPTSADLERFAQYGTVGYVSQSISVVQLRGVRLADTLLLAQDERVAMVEWDASVHAGLHTGVAAMRVTASEVYSPDTVEDRYPGLIGLGVNIAFLDTGIDDGVHESLPASKFVGGFDVFTGQEGNPDDLGLGGGGHGTAVASAALGVGRFRGVAPGAGLIDIKVIPRAGAQGSSAGVLAGIDKCIEKRLAWNIGVMNLSLHQSIGLSALNLRQSNGLDALSQAVNRAVQEGIVAVVSVGNQRDPTIPVEDDVLIPRRRRQTTGLRWAIPWARGRSPARTIMPDSCQASVLA